MPTEFNWNSLIKEVSRRIPSERFRTWIEPLQFIEINSENLVVAAENDFIKDLVPQLCGSIFHEILYDVFGLDVELKVIRANLTQDHLEEIDSDSSAMLTMLHGGTLHSKIDAITSSEELEVEPVEQGFVTSKVIQINDDHAALSVSDLTRPAVRTIGQALNPKHTFESFVVGSSNQFAYAAAKAVSENPAKQYNPLFLYGNSGLGKTHLLHAIGNDILRFNPRAKICYVSAEKFVNDLIEAIQHKKTPEFRQKYRQGYDVLLIDDIQFIANKVTSQDEFFHTFNALHASNKQIVVASDKYPSDIPGLEERIRTRFQFGLIVDIQSPDLETRIAILRNKALTDDTYLPNDVALYLASNIRSNVRQLEGTLLRLGAKASLSGVEISLDLAKHELKDIIKQSVEHINYDTIINTTCKHFGIKPSELKSKDRSRRVALPRQIAMYLLRKHSDKSLDEIGLILGGKDHSTIHHGVKTITETIELNPIIKHHVEEIQNSL